MNKKGNQTAVEPLYNAHDVAAIGDYLRRIDAERGQPVYIIWLLCVNCGLRIGDVLRLRVYQICGTGKRVRRYLELREQKRGKPVKRLLPDDVRRLLQGYVDGLDWTNIKYQSYLFESPRRPGKPWSYQFVNERLKQAAIVCGIDQPITTHTMRKTFAYHYYASNKGDRSQFPTEQACLEFLSKSVLQHSSVSVTERYIGIEQDKIDATTSKVMFI